MSAKKSWDIQPSRSSAPQPVRRVQVARTQRPTKRTKPVRRETTHKEPLKVRRQKQRQVFTISLSVLGVLVLILMFVGIWRPEVRVRSIQAEGPNAEQAKQITQAALWGTYGYIVPKDSIFLYPEEEIRIAIQEALPDVAAVSVSRSGFNEIEIVTVSRTSAFVWCGTHATEPASTCYTTDAEGYIFSVAQGEMASTSIKIYAPLDSGVIDNPIRSKVVGASYVPGALQFVRALNTLGVSVSAISLRGDEADVYAKAGERVTYVLGREAEAATLAASAFPTLTFGNGSIEYVDLRFEKKVYVKRYE